MPSCFQDLRSRGSPRADRGVRLSNQRTFINDDTSTYAASRRRDDADGGCRTGSAVSARRRGPRSHRPRSAREPCNRSIPVYVVPANRPNAPTIYLLDGLRAPANDTVIDQHPMSRTSCAARCEPGDAVRRCRQLLHRLAAARPKLGLNRWETFPDPASSAVHEVEVPVRRCAQRHRRFVGMSGTSALKHRIAPRLDVQSP